MNEKIIKTVFNAKPNGSPQTFTVDIARLKTVLWLAALMIPLSSLVTFMYTAPSQIKDLREELSAVMTRTTQKDFEHDVALSVIKQQLFTLNANVEKLIDIQLRKDSKSK